MKEKERKLEEKTFLEGGGRGKERLGGVICNS